MQDIGQHNNITPCCKLWCSATHCTVLDNISSKAFTIKLYIHIPLDSNVILHCAVDFRVVLHNNMYCTET